MVAVQRASTKAAQAPIEAKTEIEVKDESIFPVPNFTVKQFVPSSTPLLFLLSLESTES